MQVVACREGSYNQTERRLNCLVCPRKLLDFDPCRSAIHFSLNTNKFHVLITSNPTSRSGGRKSLSKAFSFKRRQGCWRGHGVSSLDCAPMDSVNSKGHLTWRCRRVVPLLTLYLLWKHKHVSINQKSEVLTMPKGAGSGSPVALAGKLLGCVKTVPHRPSAGLPHILCGTKWAEMYRDSHCFSMLDEGGGQEDEGASI